jgi:hypothetical protein
MHTVDAGIVVSFAANCSNKVIIYWGGPFIHAQQNSYCLRICIGTASRFIVYVIVALLLTRGR